MNKTTFFLDALGDTPITGYSTGEVWNGFACPVFTRAQALAIVDAWHGRGWAAHYDESGDAFHFSVNQHLETGESDELETFHAVLYREETVYPVGSGMWAWEEVEDEFAA